MPVHVTGVVKVGNAKVAVLEGDSVESEKKYITSLEFKNKFNFLVYTYPFLL